MPRIKKITEDEAYANLLKFSDEPHGDWHTFNKGCRCSQCRIAHNKHDRELSDRIRYKNQHKCTFCNRAILFSKKGKLCSKCIGYKRSMWYNKQDLDKSVGRWYKVEPNEFVKLRQLPAYWWGRKMVFCDGDNRYYLDVETREVCEWNKSSGKKYNIRFENITKEIALERERVEIEQAIDLQLRDDDYIIEREGK